MPTVNEELRDAYILRSVLLEQLKSNEANKVKRAYKSILDDIIKRINENEAISVTNVAKIINEIKDLVAPNLNLTTDYQDIALHEQDWIINTTNGIIGGALFKKIQNENIIKNIADAELFQGHSLLNTFTMFNDKLKFELDGEIKQSVLQGETISQVKQRIKDRFGIVGSQADTIARTSVHTLVNQVREKVYKENEEVIKGYQHHSTLDSRTTLLCASRDGMTWDINYKPTNGNKFKFIRPPLHPNCRSIMLTILKSWEDLGMSDLPNVPEGTRSSMDGSVPASMTFDKWIANKSDSFIEKYLGEGRYNLYKDGNITLKDLVTSNGKTLTLEELKAKYL